MIKFQTQKEHIGVWPPRKFLALHFFCGYAKYCVNYGSLVSSVHFKFKLFGF